MPRPAARRKEREPTPPKASAEWVSAAGSDDLAREPKAPARSSASLAGGAVGRLSELLGEAASATAPPCAQWWWKTASGRRQVGWLIRGVKQDGWRILEIDERLDDPRQAPAHARRPAAEADRCAVDEGDSRSTATRIVAGLRRRPR